MAHKHGTPFAPPNGMNKNNTVLICAVALLATFLSSPVLAGDFSAVLNGKSYHLNSSYDWNESNFGAGIEYAFDSESKWRTILMANGFRDSESKMSYMAGGGLHRELYQTDRLSGFYVMAGINAFVMTRNDVDDNRPFPGVLPSVTVGNQYAGLNLTYLPKKAVESMVGSSINDPTVSGIVFVQLKISIDQLLKK